MLFTSVAKVSRAVALVRETVSLLFWVPHGRDSCAVMLMTFAPELPRNLRSTIIASRPIDFSLGLLLGLGPPRV